MPPISATLPGFGTLVREGIDVALGQAVNVPLTLRLSAVSEKIVVTSENPVVENMPVPAKKNCTGMRIANSHAAPT